MKSRAFTLIELLVVVLIIGILSAIALPQYQIAVYKSRLTQVAILMKAIKQANQIYYLSNGEYTNDPDNWDIDLPAGYSITDKENPVTTITLSDDSAAFEVVKESADNVSKPRVQGWCKGCPARLWVSYAEDQWKCYPRGSDLGARLCRSFGASNCQKTSSSCLFSF